MAGTAPNYDNVQWPGSGGLRVPQEQAPATLVVTKNPGNVLIGGTQSFTAAGAIPLVSGTYIINGSGALAMTLATPTTPLQDGITLTIIAGTAHAHTVTTAANKIVPSHSTVTFAAAGDYVTLVSSGGLWYPIALGGTTPAVIS